MKIGRGIPKYLCKSLFHSVGLVPAIVLYWAIFYATLVVQQNSLGWAHKAGQHKRPVQSFDKSVRSMFSPLVHHQKLHNIDLPVCSPGHKSVEKAKWKLLPWKNLSGLKPDHHQGFTLNSVGKEAPYVLYYFGVGWNVKKENNSLD